MIFILSKSLEFSLGFTLLVLLDFLSNLSGLFDLSGCLGPDKLLFMLVLTILVQLGFPLQLLSLLFPLLLNGIVLVVLCFLVSLSDTHLILNGRLFGALEAVLYGLLALIVHLSHGV